MEPNSPIDQAAAAHCPAPQPRRLVRVRWRVAESPSQWKVTPVRRQSRLERSRAEGAIRPPSRELPFPSGRSMRDFFAIELDAEGDDAHPRWVYIPIG
jgi:hypothetical protein